MMAVVIQPTLLAPHPRPPATQAIVAKEDELQTSAKITLHGVSHIYINFQLIQANYVGKLLQ